MPLIVGSWNVLLCIHWSLIASAPLSAPKILALRSSSTFTLYTTPQLKVYFSSESEFLEVIVKTFKFFRFSYHINISLQPFCFFIQGNIWASRKRFLRLICCETSVLDIISGGGGFSKSQQCLISCLDLSNDGKYESPHWSEKTIDTIVTLETLQQRIFWLFNMNTFLHIGKDCLTFCPNNNFQSDFASK